MKSLKQLIKDAKSGSLSKEDIERIKCSIRFWKFAEDELYPLLGYKSNLKGSEKE